MKTTMTLSEWIAKLTEDGSMVRIEDQLVDDGHRSLAVTITPPGGEPRFYQGTYSPDAISRLHEEIDPAIPVWEMALVGVLEQSDR